MKTAIYTICRDEPVFLPIWFKYYKQFFNPEDISILHHTTEDPDNEFDRKIWSLAPGAWIEGVFYGDTFDHKWLRETVQEKQKDLLTYYDIVVFAEIDEIIWHPLGLKCYIEHLKEPVATCRGFEVVHHYNEEPAIDLSKPLLAQRRYGYYAKLYNKTLISKIPLDWVWGFHSCPQEIKPSMDLHLIHLHKLDFETAWQRNLSHRHTLIEKETGVDLSTPGGQNLIQKREHLEHWWNLSVDGYVLINHIDIPKYIKNAI